MNCEEPVRVIEVSSEGTTEGALIIFASPEDRCLGVSRALSGYRAKNVLSIEVCDEPSLERTTNIHEISNLCKGVGRLHHVPFKHSDPIFGLRRAAEILQTLKGAPFDVTVDISTFPRNALLLFLRLVESCSAGGRVRLLYTEPARYSEPTRAAFGLNRIAAIPTFVAPFRPSGEFALVVLLGFEGDRALGVWQAVEPHRTIAVIPSPAYRPEWEGVSERLNAALLAPLEEESIRYVDPRNPWATYRLLCDITKDARFFADTNFFVSPVGTKPEAVGLYSFCRDYPDACTVLYSANAEHTKAYISRGIGEIWQLPLPAWNCKESQDATS
jgi:hypothetical protein